MSRSLLPRCEFGVPAATEEGIEACGEPAVVSWHDGKDRMFLCEKHEIVVSNQEDEAMETVNEGQKAERLEKELSAAKRLLDETSKGWERTHQTLHERFVSLDSQLAESRRNFQIIAKLLRGTE